MDNNTMVERFQFFPSGADITARKTKLKESVAEDVVDAIDMNGETVNFEELCGALEMEFEQL